MAATIRADRAGLDPTFLKKELISTPSIGYLFNNG
jgi:hypothetical protein